MAETVDMLSSLVLACMVENGSYSPRFIVSIPFYSQVGRQIS